MDNRLLANIARKGGIKLLDLAIDRLLLEQPKPSAKVSAQPASPSVTKKVTNATLGNVARRSVPAAIVIGGAVLAKALHDRRKAQKAAQAAARQAPEPGGDAEA